MMKHVKERNSHWKAGVVIPITLLRGCNSVFARNEKSIKMLKVNHYRLHMLKLHYLPLYNLLVWLYNVSNNCL